MKTVEGGKAPHTQTAGRCVAAIETLGAVLGPTAPDRLHVIPAASLQDAPQTAHTIDTPIGPVHVVLLLPPDPAGELVYRPGCRYVSWVLPGTEAYTARDLQRMASQAGRLFQTMGSASPQERHRLRELCYGNAVGSGFLAWALSHLDEAPEQLAKPERWRGVLRAWNRGWGSRPRPPALS